MPFNKTNDQSPSPIYGLPTGFRISDLPVSTAVKTAIVYLNAVTTAQTSTAQQQNARSLEFVATFSDAVTSCDITIIRVDAGPVDTPVITYTGVNYKTAGRLFAGGKEGIDFDGKQSKVQIANISGTGTITIKGYRTS
jgi:hypothetical protein